jgi:hypothetical protein
MTRVLSSACVVLLLLGLGNRAWAGGKPSIAILGLEVYDNGSGIDPDTTKAAKELTAALRDRAKAGTGPYTPVQGGDKELIDEKLLNNCDSEAASCMAAIGSDLGAEALMYGKIEKVTQNGVSNYRVSLRLLNVGRKQLAGSTVETVPLDAASSSKAPATAKSWYSKLTGGSGGTLVVRASNIERGTVLIDGDAKGDLASGTFTLQGLPEGRYTLAIEAKDYQRYEGRITIRAGETTTHAVTMVDLTKKPPLAPGHEHISTEGTVAAKSGSNVWKPVFYGTAVAGAVAGGIAVFEWRQQVSDAAKITAKHMDGTAVSQADCGKYPDAHLADACSDHDRWKVSTIVGAVLGAAAIGSFYMAYVRDSGSESESKTALGHHKHRELVVTPVITPQGGGATLQFDW